MAQPQIQIIDCAADSQTSYTKTIPDDAWMTQVILDGVVISAAGLPRMRLDAVATNYRRSFHTTTSDDVDTQVDIGLTSLNGTTHSGHTTLIGAKLAAPTYYRSCHIDVGDVSPQHDTGMQLAVMAHTTIKIDTVGGQTFNSGFIYLVHYIRKHEIIEQVDFSVVTENSHDFDVGKHNSLCLLAPGLLFGVADEPRLRVSTDGVSFDAGASDYEKGSQNTGGQTAEATDNLYSSRRSATTNDIAVHMEGFNLANAISCVVNAASMADANTAPSHTAALRAAAQKNTHLRLFSVGANNFTGGIAYLIGAK